MDPDPSASAARPSRGVIGRLVDLFSSITLGVWLLSILFVYSSIGSAGVLYPTGWNLFDWDVWHYEQLRQRRVFEMTEFEWFHWWPFDLMIGLICVNLVVATLRRIPLRVVNLGVWMIHAGIITLALGSVWYFGTKIEGDSPVVRRQVVVTLPTGETDALPAVPGATLLMGNWSFDVSSVNLAWKLVSGPDEGKEALAVTVRVNGPSGGFQRQLLDGYPQYTEDIIPSGDPAQPMARAKKVIGTALVDDSLQLSLERAPQEHVYLANWIEKSWALYLRRQGERDWIQRPIEDLPLYNDYVGSRDEVWMEPGSDLPLDPLDVVVPPFEDGDPLAATDLRISGYLRHAVMERRHMAGGPLLDPTATVHMTAPGQPHMSYDLVAFDPQRRQDPSGVLRLVWARDENEREAFAERRDPVLEIRVAATGEVLELPLTLERAFDPDPNFVEIAGADRSYRVDFWRDDWEIEPGRLVSMAQVSVRDGDREYKRWVFAHPQASQVDRETVDHSTHDHEANPHGPDDAHGDGAHGGGQVELDAALDMTYRPGRRPAPITLVAGPGDDDLSLILTTRSKATGVEPVVVGEPVDLGDGVSMEIGSFTSRGAWQSRPYIVPEHRRDRDVRERNAMVKLTTADGDVASVWVPFHQYPVRTVGENLRRYRYRPAEMMLSDGTVIELVLSRRRLDLPAPVVLDDFELITHVGGFTGSNLSVRNWRSWVRFGEEGARSEALPVAVNEPAEHEGYWYFQAQWDPPSGPRFQGDASSQGLNYTVLGVGNRNGVGVQLIGCCIAVLGMLYAFYVKPTLIRRMRREREAAATGTPSGAAEGRPAELVGGPR